MAVGTHQGFLAVDPEKVSQASCATPSTPTTEDAGKDADDMGCIPLPISTWNKTIDIGDSVTLDMGSMGEEDDLWREDKSKQKNKTSFRLPASLKARLAVRKKPVITWRPYSRQMSLTQILPEVLPDYFPDVMEADIPDEIKGAIPKDLPPGHFEEECAFMWRTIEDDSDSMQTANSAMSDDPQSDSWFLDTTALSHYKDVKPQPPEVKVEEYDFPREPKPQRLAPRRTLGMRRARYKTRARMRCLACSMPLLNTQRRNASLVPSIARSLSENSVFLEAVARRLTEHSRSQDKPFPRPKCQQLSLSIPSLKPAKNGRHTWSRSSPSSPDSQ